MPGLFKQIMKRLKIEFFIFSLILFLVPAWIQAQEVKNPVDVIVIDAGHGGIDLGAPGSISNEKDITLALSLKVGNLIRENMPGVKVIYTRDDDRFVPLHKRAAIANDSLADLFISIHCNSNPEPKYFGAETYVMGVHKTEENLEVAKTENSAILMEDNYDDTYDGFDPELDEDYITLTMFQTSSMEQSIRFSMMVQDRLKNTAGMYDRGVKQAGFVVLYLTTMPGVLVETGFISNPAEEKYLLDPVNQDRISMAIFEAVQDYKKHHDQPPEPSTISDNAENDEAAVFSDTLYRICFARTKKLISFDHRMFAGLEDVWAWEKNGFYYYAFGKTGNRAEAQNILEAYLESGRGRPEIAFQPYIVEFSIVQ